MEAQKLKELMDKVNKSIAMETEMLKEGKPKKAIVIEEDGNNWFEMIEIYEDGKLGQTRTMMSFGESSSKKRTRSETAAKMKARMKEQGLELVFNDETPIEFYDNDVRELFVF